MKALLFKDISDTYTEVEVFVGQKIRENFLDKDLTKYVILVNGTLKTPDHVIQEKDIIVIRKIPTAKVGRAIVDGLVAFGEAIWSAITLPWKLYETRKQIAALQDKIKNMSLKDSVANIPYLKGANNSVAKGKSQPYIIGEHLFTPYLLTQSFSTIANEGGRDQFLHIVLECGFNKQVIRNIKSDDVIIKTWDDSLTTPQEGLYSFDAGSVFASPDSVIEIRQNGNEFSTPAFNQKRITQETGEELKKADDERYEPLYFTLAENTMSADVCILFNGLRAYDKETGNKKARTIVVNAEYKIQGGSWTSFPFLVNGSPTNTFSGNTSSQLRYNAHIDFSYADIKDKTEPIQIRLSSPTKKYDGSAYDSVYVQWVQSVIYNPDASRTRGYFIPEKIIEQNERNLSTLIGLKIKATQANQEKLSKIHIVTAGVARVWNGSEWSPSKVPTRNPASWLLEVLTSPTHTASQCSDSEIDLDSFGELYEYCETENYKIDMAIIEGDTKTNLLSTILETCNSLLYEDIYGQISVATDKEKPNAIAVINTQNCISFSVEKSLARQTDGLRMKYISRAGGYDTNTYLVMKEGKIRNSESIIRDINVTGITEHEHIVKNARRMMAIETLRPKSVKIKIGKEGQYFPPLSKVLVQHPALKIGLGSAEIKSVIVSGSYIIGLELYDAIERSESLTGYGMLIQCVSSTYSTPLAVAYRAIEDNPKEIVFTIPISLSATVIPRAGNILSYGVLNSGNFDTITSPMLISGAEPDADGFNLTLVDYNTNIYSTGSIPEYTPNMTERITPVSVPETISPATLDDVSKAMATVVSGVDVSEPDDILSLVATAHRDYINVNWDWGGSSISNLVKRFIVEGSVDSGNTWKELGEPTTNQFVYYFDRDTDGYPEKTTGTYSLDKWRFRAKAENIYGKVSLGYSPIASVNVASYTTWIPELPNLATRASGRNCSLSWNKQEGIYGEIGYRIQISKDSTNWFAPIGGVDPKASEENWFAGAEGMYLIYSTEVWSQGLPLDGQDIGQPTDTLYYYRVERVNKTTGIASGYSAISLVATATSARDVVSNAITEYALDDEAVSERVIAAGAVVASKIAVDELSAISANIGIITDGSIAGSENNKWDISTGLFKIGDGLNNVLEFNPVTGLTIKTSKFETTAVSSNIAGDFSVGTDLGINPVFSAKPSDRKVDIDGTLDVYNTPKTARARINESGMSLQKKTGSTWNSSGVMRIDEGNNLFITNDVDNMPPTGIIDSGATVYHFNENTLDSEGGNAGSITADGDIVDLPSVVEGTKYFDGTISRTMPVGKQIIWNKSNFFSLGSTEVGDKTPDWYNDLASTNWGLTAGQVSARIFKVKVEE